METTLFQFVFHITAVCLTKVTQYFRQHQLQCIRTYILHRTTIGVFYLLKTLPAHIKRSSIKMAGVQRSISVGSPQTLYVILRTSHGRYNDFIGVQSFGFQ